MLAEQNETAVQLFKVFAKLGESNWRQYKKIIDNLKTHKIKPVYLKGTQALCLFVAIKMQNKDNYITDYRKIIDFNICICYNYI